MTGSFGKISESTGKEFGAQKVSQRPISILCYKTSHFNSVQVPVLGVVTNAEIMKTQGLHWRSATNTWVCTTERNAVHAMDNVQTAIRI